MKKLFISFFYATLFFYVIGDEQRYCTKKCLPVICTPISARAQGLYSHISVGQQLLDALKEKRAEKFQTLLHNAAQRYHNNPEQFFMVINQRDQDQFNIAQFATLAGDVENLATIFDVLEHYFGSYTNYLFNYFIQRDKRGLTILGLAEYNESRNIFELVLMRTTNLISNNKKLFFDFLTAGDYEEDAKPLGDASYDSEYTIVEMLVRVAASVFGKDSHFFKAFLNAEEKTGNNALSFAGSNRIRFFLLDYGAEMPKEYELDPQFPQVKDYGMQMNQAINFNNFRLFKRILKKAKNYTGDNLFKFFSIPNGAGWNPFINAAADGKYKYLELLFKTVDEVFEQEDKITKTLLVSNGDFLGRTPLHLAIIRRHYDEAKLIIDNAVQYSVNKPYLYAALNVPNELNGYTPFINAIYASDEYDYKTYEFVEYFLKKAVDLFGRDSRLFYLFLNSRDYNGWTPLSYASDPNVIKLLKSYGAIDTPAKKIKGIGEFERLKIEGDL